MRRILLTAFILSLLTACAARTAAPTATLPPVPTETATMIVAETQTLVPPTNTPEPTTPPKIETRLNPIYETPLVEVTNEQGATIKMKVITDATLDPVITALKIHEGWKNKEGLTSEQALAKFVAMSVYRVVVENNGYTGTYEEYMADLAKAQESGSLEDWRKVQITTKVDDWGTEQYDAKKTTMFPFYIDKGMKMPDDVRMFTELDLAAVKVKDNNSGKILEEGKYEITAGTYGFGTSLSPDGILYGVVGIATARINDFARGYLTCSFIVYWSNSFLDGAVPIKMTTISSSENKEIAQILISDVGNVKSKSVFDDK